MKLAGLSSIAVKHSIIKSRYESWCGVFDRKKDRNKIIGYEESIVKIIEAIENISNGDLVTEISLPEIDPLKPVSDLIIELAKKYSAKFIKLSMDLNNVVQSSINGGDALNKIS